MNKTSTKGMVQQKAQLDKTKESSHQGSTAAFLVKETSDALNAIRAKIESAERRTNTNYGKGGKIQDKKNVKQFVEPI